MTKTHKICRENAYVRKTDIFANLHKKNSDNNQQIMEFHIYYLSI